MFPQRPARHWSFDLVLHSCASPERIFTLLSDAPGWPSWFAPARSVDWCPPGEVTKVPGAMAMRRVRIGPLAVREAVMADTAPTHHAYSICSTLPVRNHRADVILERTPTGTRIRWTSDFTALVPGTGRTLRAGLQLGVRRLAAALVKEAESP